MITIASAVTAVGMKYAVMNYQMDQIDKKLDKKQEYIDDLEKNLSDVKAELKVKGVHIKQLAQKLNERHARDSERYEDE